MTERLEGSSALRSTTLAAAQRLGAHRTDGEGGHIISSSALRYHGRCLPVDLSSPLRGDTLRTVTDAVNALRPLARSSPASETGGWRGLCDDLSAVAAILSDPALRIPEYKLEILRLAICPYLIEMKGRWVLDPERFLQLHQVLGALHLAEPVVLLSEEGFSVGAAPEHPARSLLEIEAVLRAIDAASSKAWFQSQLARRLREHLNHQWAPILSVLRSDLRSIAFSLLVIALLELIARPTLFAYPLWKLLWEVVTIVRSIEENRGVKAREVLQIAKSIVMLLLIFQAIQLLNALSGMGYVCGSVGMGLLVFQSSDALLKTYSPQLAENMAKVVMLVDAVHSLETRFTSTHSLKPPMNGAQRLSQSTASVPRVEEVSEEESYDHRTPTSLGSGGDSDSGHVHAASAPPHHLMDSDDGLPVATASVLLQALGSGTLSGALSLDPPLSAAPQLRHRHKTKIH